MRHIALVSIVLLGCRSQSLPEPPAGGDATAPDAAAPRHAPPPPLERSAFEGVKLRKGMDHGHGGHAGHGAAKKDAAKSPAHHQEDDPGHEHGHGPGGKQ